jgi:DNA-binding NtrC family response regulator
VLLQHSWPGNIRELQNVIAQAICMADGDVIHAQHLAGLVRHAPRAVAPSIPDRRLAISDELFTGIVEGRYGFWEHLHKLFLNRDITRQDVRDVVSRGLTMTRGSYRGLVKVFRMNEQDYKKLLNFLSTHECTVDGRAFRGACWMEEPPPEHVLPLPSPLPRRDTYRGATA